MSSQVLRFENRPTLDSALEAHNRGDADARPDEAAGRAMYDGRAAIDLGSEPEQARLLIAQALMIRRRGRKGDHITEFMIAGPPPFESEDAWPVERLDAFARDSTQWLRDILPDGVPLHTVSMHVDERSPHIQGCLPNITFDDAERTRPRVSWDRTLSSMTATAVKRLIEAGEPTSTNYTDRQRLSIIQDSFQAEVGRRYGLDRGEIGSKRPHEPPDRERGLSERLSDTDRINRATAERAAAEAAARSAAEERADETAAQLADEQRRAAALAEAKAAAEERAEKAETRASEQAKLRAAADSQAAAEAARRKAAEQQKEAAEISQAEVIALRVKTTAELEKVTIGRKVAETRAGLAKVLADRLKDQLAQSERRAQSRQRREAKAVQRETRRQRSPVTRAPQAISTQPAHAQRRDPPTTGRSKPPTTGIPKRTHTPGRSPEPGINR